jgi:hypothetical protein
MIAPVVVAPASEEREPLKALGCPLYSLLQQAKGDDFENG